MNTLLFRIVAFMKKERNILMIWLLGTIFCAIQSYLTHRYNNYLIFKYVYEHLIQKVSLYTAYPEYGDVNHYGPVFGVFIMPWALLPDWLGLLAWDLFNTLLLFYAIRRLKLPNRHWIYWIALPCLISSALSEQFNAGTAAFIILSYSLVKERKDFWATLFIALGFFIKLYGIIGLIFFFLSKNKWRFSLSMAFWSVVCFCLPMLLSSPSYVIHAYQEWQQSLLMKNASNLLGASIDISIMGFVRSLFQAYEIPNWPFLAIGLIGFMLPFCRFDRYYNKRFGLGVLASALLFVVLFSTGTEDCTYIIGAIGVGILSSLTVSRRTTNIILILVLIVSLSLPQLFFSDFANKHIVLKRMMAMPFFLAWVRIIYEMTFLEQPFEVTKESIRPLVGHSRVKGTETILLQE